MTDAPPSPRAAPTTVILPPGHERMARRVVELLREAGVTGPITVQATSGEVLAVPRRVVSPAPSSGGRRR